MDMNMIRQFEYENDSWKRSLEFMQMENVHLKMRLAQIIKSDLDNNLLDLFEFFQNYFIQEDQVIAILRNDVLKHDLQIKQAVYDWPASILKVINTQKRLRQDLELEEKKFNQLKMEFNSYFVREFDE